MERALFVLLFIVLVVLGLFIPLAPTRSAWGELILDGEHTWAVRSPVPTGHVVEYLACDPDGACVSAGVGDTQRAGAPLFLEDFSIELTVMRARYCLANGSGVSLGICGPLSMSSPEFRYQPGVEAQPMSLSVPPKDKVVHVVAGRVYQTFLPLGFVPPLAGVLSFSAKPHRSGVVLQLELRGVRNPDSVYYSEVLALAETGSTVTRLLFDELTEAATDEESELEFVVEVILGGLWMLNGDPLLADMLAAPHLWLAPQFQTFVELTDTDGDGVPFVDRPEYLPCGSGEWLGCLDNCPAVANLSQADVDENGIGDTCEVPAAGELDSDPTYGN